MKFDQPMVFHGFNNKQPLLEQVLKANGYVSIGGALLQEKSNAQNILTNIPLAKLFFETDQSSIDISHIYTKAAQLLKIELIDLCQIIEENFSKVFLQNKDK